MKIKIQVGQKFFHQSYTPFQISLSKLMMDIRCWRPALLMTAATNPNGPTCMSFTDLFGIEYIILAFTTLYTFNILPFNGMLSKILINLIHNLCKNVLSRFAFNLFSSDNSLSFFCNRFHSFCHLGTWRNSNILRL